MVISQEAILRYFLLFLQTNWKKEKESIQQQVPLQLPCYDLVTIMSFTVDQKDYRGSKIFRNERMKFQNYLFRLG